MKTYYARGVGYDRTTQTEKFFEIAFDVEYVDAVNFSLEYREALKAARGLELVKTEYIIVLS